VSIDISQQTEDRLTEEARRQGMSVDPLIERL
jgi:lipocalin